MKMTISDYTLLFLQTVPAVYWLTHPLYISAIPSARWNRNSEVFLE
jgi:hypothetical protein